jgi:hypothetical protein
MSGITLTNEQFQQLLNIQQPRHEDGNFSTCTNRFAGRTDEDVYTFIEAVSTYKDCARVNDENALRGLPMLLEGLAATWWRGIKNTTDTWVRAIQELKETYGTKKTNDQLYLELFASKQEGGTPTDRFVCTKRALLAQFSPNHSQDQQIDMVYALLCNDIKKRVRRSAVTTFRELLEEARIVEQTIFTLPTEGKSNVNEETPRKPKKTRCSFCNIK